MLGVGLLVAAPLSCKVPIHGVGAEFLLADTSWFAEEDTLFVFYEISAEQGISENSVVEITFTTDDGEVDWTPLSAFTSVHPHVPVDCGLHTLCGSTSIHVAREPRDVELRMRYHRDGELALDSDTALNVVGRGQPHQSRSLVVYGVFDTDNQRIQWRGRHQFPVVRNEEASELGLRRWFHVDQQASGEGNFTSTSNPYGYGATCPDTFLPANLPSIETLERAIFDEGDLPQDAATHPVVCARTSVLDAKGAFTTGAIAQKNPEVRPAFSELYSPVRDATVLPFFLAPCEREISAPHEAMQRQRLLLGDLAPFCIDDWEDPAFEDRLIVAFTDAVEAERARGNDMVLVIGVHHDDRGVSELVERALTAVLPEERHRSSPRLAGAFVFDSNAYSVKDSPLGPAALWCPASIAGIDADDIADASLLSCAIAPDDLSIELGPFTFGVLPILPSRDSYLSFIEDFSEAQAGSVQSYTIRTPEFSATSDHADLGEFGVITFLDDERISAEVDDAFSYCASDEPWIFLFRSDLLQSDVVQAAIAQACELGEVPEDLCAIVSMGVLPIEYLPEWHQQFPDDGYDLGMYWDFPFLLHMNYELVTAGAVSAFGFNVPFGLAADGEQYLGSAMWTTERFPVGKELAQCVRFCDHPTLDSAGVYHVTDPFVTTYATSCYLPNYPRPGESGFPLDP